MLKGEIGRIPDLLKIPLHQQTFLLVLVLSTSLWLPRNLKQCSKTNYKTLFSWQRKY